MFKVSDYLAGGRAAEIINELYDGKDVSVLNAHLGQKTAISCLLPEFVYVCPDYVTAREVYAQISCMADAVYLPALDDVLTYARITSGENNIERIKALYRIAKGAKAIVTHVAALTQLYPDVEMFKEMCFTLRKGGSFDFSSLSGRLVKAGYRRVTHIDGVGQFAIRGDIVDISPVIYESGIRVEFFGDEVDSVKLFDYYTQRSLSSIDEAEICPATFVTSSDSVDLSLLKGDNSNIIGDITFKLASGGNDLSLSFIAPLLPHSTFEEFVPVKYIVYDDAKQVSDSLTMVIREHESRLKTIISQGAPYVEGQLVKTLPRQRTKLAFQNISHANRIFDPQAVISLIPMPNLMYRRNLPSLVGDIKGWNNNGFKVVICCGDEKMMQNLSASLADNNVSAILTADKLETGFAFGEIGLVVIGTYDLVSKKSERKRLSAKKEVFTIPEPGEYVVHNIHGIGMFECVAKMSMGGCVRDYIVIKYRDGDTLYVPVENIDCLSRYIAGGEAPKLSKIGGADFARIKEKVKASVKEMAFSLLKLYAERSESKGYKYSPDNTLQDEFDAAFDYEPTADQLTAESECLSDLIGGKIMDRLLCGDVGYGKTEVALRVAFKVISEGKQVAFVSPTTILAKQHYKTALERMEPFGVNICSLTRLDDGKAIKSALSDLPKGKIDLAVGTHRLLSSDVKFKDLGLLILDEEQRFGVADKEKLKLLKRNVNVLTLSATPIPRTLHMSMTGIRDLSVLSTPPADRIPVQTYVSEYSDSLVYDAVMRELGRGGQVFIVYNRVEKIDLFAARMKSLLGDVKITVGHGQMKEQQLENAVSEFAEGRSDILIASTIIENGIDMPRANTMIVIDADRLGLSQLYQLRGRIGRSNRLAYVFSPTRGYCPKPPTSGSKRSRNLPTSAPALRSPCATSKFAGRATCSARRNTVISKRWATICIANCSKRRSRSLKAGQKKRSAR